VAGFRATGAAKGAAGAATGAAVGATGAAGNGGGLFAGAALCAACGRADPPGGIFPLAGGLGGQAPSIAVSAMPLGGVTCGARASGASSEIAETSVLRADGCLGPNPGGHRCRPGSGIATLVPQPGQRACLPAPSSVACNSFWQLEQLKAIILPSQSGDSRHSPPIVITSEYHAEFARPNSARVEFSAPLRGYSRARIARRSAFQPPRQPVSLNRSAWRRGFKIVAPLAAC
jgi:hypothetical protein